MSETIWPILKASIPALILCIQIYLGIDIRNLVGDVEKQSGEVEELSAGLRVQEVLLQASIAQQAEIRSEISATTHQKIRAEIKNEISGDDSAAALQMARQAQSLGEAYRQLLRDREQRMAARETELRARTDEIRQQAAEAIADLREMKQVLDGAAGDARFAAARANASPRYVMVEGGAGPADFWLPDDGEFQATLDDVVEDEAGNHVAHVVVKASAREPFQLRLGEFSGYQALPETNWVVRPALVYDSLTFFGRRRLVILEMIPSAMADDPAAVPVLHRPGVTAPGPVVESAAG
ncbi:MAG: hypothetical protein QNK05_19970 [Myxococcota bacterium]|nr:hypothetical protein [Myxococcota bacterium]